MEKEEDFSPTLSTALAGPGGDLYHKRVAGSVKYSMCFFLVLELKNMASGSHRLELQKAYGVIKVIFTA